MKNTPINRNNNFKIGDTVVYPSHGVGEIVSEEIDIIAGVEMSLYVINFNSDQMVLRVPKSRAIKTGLRHLCNADDFESIIDILKKKLKVNRSMWSRRAQEYEQKINSGNLFLIAEVLRSTYKSEDEPARSYSERIIYDTALDRLSSEYAIIYNVSKKKLLGK